ncbi:lipase 3-like [Musca autumnalis]|uniref:lipase 3-like n=1 Tax=Musca autumnalis TaxID=221902 RepID=UPI003CEC07BC
MKVQLAFIAVFVGTFAKAKGKIAIDTCDRILQHGYPCETHKVTTSDGYVLTLFRIPKSSPNRNDTQNATMQFPVLVTHCLACTSDIFVVSGPNDGLPFLLSNAGFDVWLANARGNIYSQEHTFLSPFSVEYWDFSLDEIGRIDVPANTDYILKTTNRTKIHYIGYSQGAAVIMILLSTNPSYAEIAKSVHLLAPPIYMCHIKTPLVSMLAEILGQPGAFADFFGTFPSQGVTAVLRLLGHNICNNQRNHIVCMVFANLFSGWGSPYLNTTLLPDLLLSTPSDVSNRQYNQFLQFVKTCEFKAYDFGAKGNLLKYGTPKPPAYDLVNMNTMEPIEVYFADNDNMVSLDTTRHFHRVMGGRCNWNRVKLEKYNHFDFALATNVGECINKCLVGKLQKYEDQPFDENMCKCFINTAF